jgi:hypothetical protein
MHGAYSGNIDVISPIFQATVSKHFLCAVDCEGNNSLHHALGNPVSHNPTGKLIQITKLLLEGGLDINLLNQAGRSPLAYYICLHPQSSFGARGVPSE